MVCPFEHGLKWAGKDPLGPVHGVKLRHWPHQSLVLLRCKGALRLANSLTSCSVLNWLNAFIFSWHRYFVGNLFLVAQCLGQLINDGSGNDAIVVAPACIKHPGLVDVLGPLPVLPLV